MPTKTQTKPSMFLTDEPVKFSDAKRIVKSNGAATVDIVFDQAFLEREKSSQFFIGWKNAPVVAGWYQVDRQTHRFNPISNEKAAKLPWHDKFEVSDTVLPAVQKGQPLALYVYYIADRLLLSGGELAGGVARMALVEKAEVGKHLRRA